MECPETPVNDESHETDELSNCERLPAGDRHIADDPGVVREL